METKNVALQILSQLSGKDQETITPEMDLVADLGIDSPKALQLLLELEERLGIEIEDEDAAKIDSVSDILTYVTSRPSEASG
jgi:acyl carrier protein